MITLSARGCPSAVPVKGWDHLGLTCWFPPSQARWYENWHPAVTAPVQGVPAVFSPSSPASWWTGGHVALLAAVACLAIAGIAGIVAATVARRRRGARGRPQW
jgi:hypothetical protein